MPHVKQRSSPVYWRLVTNSKLHAVWRSPSYVYTYGLDYHAVLNFMRTKKLKFTHVRTLYKLRITINVTGPAKICHLVAQKSPNVFKYVLPLLMLYLYIYFNGVTY